MKECCQTAREEERNDMLKVLKYIKIILTKYKCGEHKKLVDLLDKTYDNLLQTLKEIK